MTTSKPGRKVARRVALDRGPGAAEDQVDAVGPLCGRCIAVPLGAAADDVVLAEVAEDHVIAAVAFDVVVAVTAHCLEVLHEHVVVVLAGGHERPGAYPSRKTPMRRYFW